MSPAVAWTTLTEVRPLLMNHNHGFTSKDTILRSVQWRPPVVGLSKEELVPGSPGGGMTLDKAVSEKRERWRAWEAGGSRTDYNRAKNWYVWLSTRH